MSSKLSKLSFLIMGLFAAVSYAADPETIVLRNFSPGLQTETDSAAIPDTATPDCLNVDVEDGSIRTRGGSVAVSTAALGGYSSSPVRFLYEYVESDGDRWIVSASSATIFKSNNGGQDNSVLTSTHGFTTSSEYCAVTAFGTMRLTDGTTNWITFNGSAVGVSTSSPHGLTCAFFGERVWTSINSTLYGTNINDVDDWTDSGLLDSDAISQPVRFNDGQGLTCLFPFKDRLLLFKAQSLDAYVRNADGLTYDLVAVSNHIGTSHCNSVVEREGDVAFLGPDAFYKYEPGSAAYKGYAGNVVRISDVIEPTVQTIQQLDSNSIFHTETGESDFAAGTLAQMSSSISPGDIVLSTWTQTDTTSADFVAGTQVNISTLTIADTAVFAVFYNNGFEGGSGAVAFGWDGGSSFGESNTSRTSTSSRTGSYSGDLGGSTDPFAPYTPSTSYSYTVEVISSTDGVIGSTNYTTSPIGTGWAQKSFNMASFSGMFIKLKFFTGSSTGGVYFKNEDLFLCNGSTLTWYDNTVYTTVNASSDSSRGLIDDFSGDILFTSGTFTTQSHDTAFVTPVWLDGAAAYAENGHTMSFQTQSSSDSVSWDAAVSWTPGTTPTSNQKRYIRGVISFSTGTASAGVDQPYLSDISFAARVSTGTYQGAHFATAITAFGSVDITETLNSGQTAYAIFTDTDTSASFATASTWISSQTITDGAVPTLTPSTYAFFRASATITAGTQNPTISELSIALTGGNQAPVWSEYHMGSYLTALSTASSSGNDSLLLYDRNTAWTMYDHDFYSMKRLLSGSILGGSNSDGKIYRFRDESLESDNGTGINAYWRSKDFDFGTPLGDKTMLRYYVTGDYEANSDAVFSYGVNRGAATTATLDLDSTTGFFRKTIIPTSLTYQKGIQHYFHFSNSDAGDSFSINSVGIRVREETQP